MNKPIWNYIDNIDGTCTLISCYDENPEIYVPSFIDGKRVSTILGYSFYGIGNTLKKVHISNGIEKIYKNAFIGCNKIEEIYIPASITKIEDRTFSYCHNITRIKIDRKNKVYDSRKDCNAIIETATRTLVLGCKNTIIPYGVTKIDDYAFENCLGLKKIDLPKSVISIGKGAFQDCIHLKEAYLNHVKTIGKYAFSRSNIESIVLPKKLEEIDDYVFEKCKSLNNVVIPDTVKRIGIGAFAHSGISKIVIPDSVIDIGQKAFNGCQKLTEIVLPRYLKVLNDEMFVHCDNLSKVTFPEELTKIGERAFARCGITSIDFPKKLEEVGTKAFERCEKLKEINLNSSLKTIEQQAFSFCGFIHIKIPSETIHIHKEAFLMCENLETVEFENTDKMRSCCLGPIFFICCPKLTKIMTNGKVCRGLAFEICRVGVDNKVEDMLEERYLMQLTKKQFDLFLDEARNREYSDICSILMSAYNKKFGDSPVIKQI